MRPNVAIDPDLRLDDRTTSRLVDGLLGALKWDAARLHRAVHKVFDEEPLGNDKAARRAIRRCQKAAGNAWLGMDPGATLKRGKGSLFFDAFDVRDNQLIIEQIMIEGDGRTNIDFDYRIRKNFTRSILTSGIITRHALVRLVQRTGCRTPEEVLDVLRRVGWLVLMTLSASEFGKHLPAETEPGWLLPVVGPRGGMSYLPMRRSHPTAGPGIITTALSHDMIKNWDAMKPLIGLVHHMYELQPGEGVGTMEQWRDAFNTSATAIKRQS